MFNNRGFCEFCNKIQSIRIITSIEKKEYNLGSIEYEKYNGECSVCNKIIHSYELTKKSDENRNKELHLLQSSIKIEKILNDELKKDIKIIDFKEEEIDKIKNFLKDKNKRN